MAEPAITFLKMQIGDRPVFMAFDQDQKVIDLLTRYSFYLNESLVYSPKSIPKYCQNLRLFILHQARRLSALDLTDVCIGATSAAVQDYLWRLKNSGKEDSTVRTQDRALKNFFSWLHSFRSGLKLEDRFNPYAGGRLMTPAPYRENPRFITTNELVTFMLKAFDSERMRVLAHFMFETGCRVSEICRVKFEDLPDPNSFPSEILYFPIIIRGSKRRGGGIKFRYSLISRVALSRVYRYFNNYLKPTIRDPSKINSALVFRNSVGKPCKSTSITDLFYQKSLEFREFLPKSFTPHMLRHGAAFSILSSDQGKDAVDKLLLVKTTFGHASIKSTQVYTNIPVDAIRRVKDFNASQLVRTRYDEAAYIFEKTFLKSK